MMRHEMIISYEIVDGMKTGMKTEGELVRCGECIRSRTDFMGLWCGTIRKSPMGYCDRGKRKDD